jgi:DNA-binding MarR family transcriptional regulator
MIQHNHNDHIEDFLGSIQILSSAVNDLLTGQLRKITGNQLTFSQWKLLKLVALTEGHTVSAVAEFLGVSNAAASKAVDRLVRRNLLRRTEAEADRRAVELSVTQEGSDLLAKVEDRGSEPLREVLGQLPAEQLRDITTALDQLSIGFVERDNGAKRLCFRCGIHFRDRCLLRQTGGECYFQLHRRTGSAENGSATPASQLPSDGSQA